MSPVGIQYNYTILYKILYLLIINYVSRISQHTSAMRDQ